MPRNAKEETITIPVPDVPTVFLTVDADGDVALVGSDADVNVVTMYIDETMPRDPDTLVVDGKHYFPIESFSRPDAEEKLHIGKLLHKFHNTTSATNVD